MKKRPLTVFMFSLCLFAFNSGTDKASFAQATSPGTNVGQKMPPFTARDQFGREVSSETLKGTNGTVLLFFRSADW